MGLTGHRCPAAQARTVLGMHIGAELHTAEDLSHQTGRHMVILILQGQEVIKCFLAFMFGFRQLISPQVLFKQQIPFWI